MLAAKSSQSGLRRHWQFNIDRSEAHQTADCGNAKDLANFLELRDSLQIWLQARMRPSRSNQGRLPSTTIPTSHPSLAAGSAACLGNHAPLTPNITELTQIICRVSAEHGQASDELLPLVYGEFRKLASARMANERVDHTLQSTKELAKAFESNEKGDRRHFSTAVVRGDIEHDQALAKLDTLRWLRRISFHLWRVTRHLNHAQFESEQTSESTSSSAETDPQA